MKPGLNIIADENIPYVTEVFRGLGKVTTVAGRTLHAAQVRDADVLLVRSVSRVDKALLHGSRVGFVATATIGTDHVDLEYIKQQNIGFASAPGSNAVSAAEYVLSCLCRLYPLATLRTKTVAIVGCGNVGSRVLQRLQILGVKTLVYDPPRQLKYADRDYVNWEQVLSADIVTAHVPLVKSGPYPTSNMFDDKFFRQRPHHSVFINTARGSVVDEAALKQALQRGQSLVLVLDVWRNEPAIDMELMHVARIASPHIAGYSLDGKVRGTQMIFDKVCEYFQLSTHWPNLPLASPQSSAEITFASTANCDEIVAQAILHAYDVLQDDAELRVSQNLDTTARAAYFDKLRKQYRVRREFSYFTACLSEQQNTCSGVLRDLGFSVRIVK